MNRGTCPKCRVAFTEIELKHVLGQFEFSKIIEWSLEQNYATVICINCKQTYGFEPIQYQYTGKNGIQKCIKFRNSILVKMEFKNVSNPISLIW